MCVCMHTCVYVCNNIKLAIKCIAAKKAYDIYGVFTLTMT